MLATAKRNMVFLKWFFKMVFQDVRSRNDGGRRGSREVHALGSGGGVGEEEAFWQQQEATWFFQYGFSRCA